MAQGGSCSQQGWRETTDWIAVRRGTREALGRNLNRRRFLRRQEMTERLLPEMDVADPGEHQKEEAYAAMLGVTVRSLRAAFPFLIVGRACQPRYRRSHIPLRSFQWAKFKIWNSGRSCVRPPAAVTVYKACSARLCRLLWYRHLGQFHPMEGSPVEGKKFNITSKTRIKIIHSGPVQENPMQLKSFFRVWFWFKTDAMPESDPKRSHVSVPEERAGLGCSGLCYILPSCEFLLLSLMRARVECQPDRLLPLINLITLRGRTTRSTSGPWAPTPWLDEQ